jgi:hypothetical protein
MPAAVFGSKMAGFASQTTKDTSLLCVAFHLYVFTPQAKTIQRNWNLKNKNNKKKY